VTTHPAVALVRLIARERDTTRLLASLHEVACQAARASGSVLLGMSPSGAGWVPASAYGLDPLALTPWLADDAGADLAARALATGAPYVVADLSRTSPDLSIRLGPATRAVIVPLLGSQHAPGLLVLSAAEGTSLDLDGAAAAGDAFVIALDRVRSADQLTLSADVRALVEALARDGSSPVTLAAALDAFCRGMARLAAADRVSIWVHDRRARELVHAAGPETSLADRGESISTADQLSPIAAALRRDGAALVPAASIDAGLGAVVRLKGRRRALGVLALEGVRVEPGGDVALLDRCEEIGRQLSAVLENVQLLDEIVRSRAELRNVFDSLDQLVVVLSSGGRIVDANRACALRLGVTREVLADRPFEDAFSGATGTWVTEHLRAAGATVSAALDDEQLDGRFDVTLTPLAGADPGSHGHVMVARDITTAGRLERERADLERRLAQSEKLLALGQFVAGIAHELNNPLQGVLGHLELVRRTRLPRPVARDLSLVYREANRAARIVRNLLVFAGSGRLTRRRVSLNRVVAEVLSLRAASLRAAGIEVAPDLDEALPAVLGDRLLLQQALVNLVVNAEQAMTHGGRLEIRTARSAAGVQVVVTDSGLGMDEQVRGRLFEPFFTTREDAGGSGLGLAIVYGIVTAHGGAIDVESSPGAGATFRITLTAAPRPGGKG
jgi:signal transduction histidine kinase